MGGLKEGDPQARRLEGGADLEGLPGRGRSLGFLLGVPGAEGLCRQAWPRRWRSETVGEAGLASAEI